MKRAQKIRISRWLQAFNLVVCTLLFGVKYTTGINHWMALGAAIIWTIMLWDNLRQGKRR